MVSWTRSVLGSICLLSWLCPASPVMAKEPPGLSSIGAGESIGAYLAADGSLALPVGFSGSLDPKGFHMTTGADGAPRFVKPGGVGPKLFGVPGGCDGQVRAITVAPSGLIYLGGRFSVCEDARANNVVAYDPLVRRFSSLGSGAGNGVDNVVEALALIGNDLYVGGGFRQAGGRPANGIARWNGSAWSELGSGVVSVSALAVAGRDLYVGGSFTQAGGQPANHIARWNGSEWFALGLGVSNGVSETSVEAIAVVGNDLYVGGSFTQAGGLPANRIARWDGSAWSAIGSGQENGVDGEFSPIVLALVFIGDNLYVGGQFSQAGGRLTNNIALWNGSSWSGLASEQGNGLSGPVSALAAIGNDLYVGGNFNQAGGQPAKRVARWNGSTWSSLESGGGNGVDSFVFALAATGNHVLVGGAFTEAGGRPASYIAHWNGSVWSALGSGVGNGVNGLVNALAFIGNDLYVGGDFSEAGGQAANNIARWNGSVWSTLGSGSDNGVNGRVEALAVFGNDLYVGGQFLRAGGQPVNYIARWNGNSWSVLGSVENIGVLGTVHSLAVVGNDLYVGGGFSQAGGQLANNIARWNGSTWSALGSGEANGVGVQFDIVFALAVYDNDLYVGGTFGQAGGRPANHIARWNGSTWYALSSAGDNGVNGWVLALAVYENELYVGGTFRQAGGQPANAIAAWNGKFWSTLDSAASNGVDGLVRALAVAGNDLYVGGRFASAGGQPANSLAQWDGSAWRGMAIDQPFQEVFAFAVDSVSVYVGGTGLVQTPLPELQTRTLSGLTGNNSSAFARASRSGNRVAFSSRASDLIPSGDNFSDIYLRDTTTGQIALISQPSVSAKGGREEFFEPAIAPAGNTVAYSGTSGQVFAQYAGLGRTVSSSRGGAPGNGESGQPMTPGAGTTVLFDTTSTNLLDTPDANGPTRDILAKDLNTGAVSLITVGPAGEPANGDSFGPWSSEDGQTVAFWSLATNLSDEPISALDAPKMGTIRQALVGEPSGLGRSATYVSRNLSTNQLGNGDSINVRLTPDARFGVFESVASNLVDDDTNGVSDIFRFELQRNGSRLQLMNLERVSLSRFGFQGNGPSYNASISDDGQFITFQTDATNLIELDRNEATDILVKWMVTKEVVRLSRTVDGEQPNGDSIEPMISGDGSTIVFGSGASNLTENDTNNADDVFAVRIREGNGPAIVTGPTDQPSLQAAALPAPNPPNPNCPAGFFIARVDDGPGEGVSPGIFGMELLLDAPGTRILAGGLNFGGLIDVSQVGFAGANIANAANENQLLNLSVTGNPTANPDGSLPVRITINRRSGDSTVEVFQTSAQINGSTPFTASVQVSPGYYETLVAAEGFPASAAGGTPEGQFFFSLTTQFVDRPGGGFQGGAVVGGYHAENPFGGVSGFASFCIATPHSSTTRVLAAPTYGPAGAGDLRLQLLDAQQNVLYSVP